MFLKTEQQFSAYNFEHANTERLFQHFKDVSEECRALVAADLPLPAYDQAIKASHIFNLLNARGVISVAERQAYIGRVRDLVKGVADKWVEQARARWRRTMLRVGRHDASSCSNWPARKSRRACRRRRPSSCARALSRG